MKYLIFAALMALPILVFAGDDQEDYSILRTETIRPCSSWRYFNGGTNGSGYICSFTGSTIYVPTADTVLDLERRIRDLEARIQQLENK
ncbi:MAG: hypothetical protein H6626_02075 [Pseudobdellovibrionaceae bacterium]|nr:hypothetical protein [Bdellovibrionales bacterium]USN47900.1 MAG: hypothetical protein H6626_02075 [Pseudobdellovibrionaceae bacterium]